MTTLSLESARAKFGWAGYHLNSLRGEVESFEARYDYTISFTRHADAGKYEFHVRGLQSVPPHWGLLIGDCVHNARCALDHLVSQLASIGLGVPARDICNVAFPIYTDSKSWKGAVAGQLKDVPPGYRTRIEELQPFNAFDPSIWGYGLGATPGLLPMVLGRLDALENTDKHRAVHAVWHRVPFAAYRPYPAFPMGYELASGGAVAGALANDAEIGDWQFKSPLPDDQWRPTPVDMQRHFPVRVCLGDLPSGQPICDMLGQLLWAVDRVLEIFGPISQGKAPQAVTAVLPDFPFV